MASPRLLMRAKYSETRISRFWVLASCIRICMTCARDCDEYIAVSAAHTSDECSRDDTWIRTPLVREDRRNPRTCWSWATHAAYAGLGTTCVSFAPFSFSTSTSITSDGIFALPSRKPVSWRSRRGGITCAFHSGKLSPPSFSVTEPDCGAEIGAGAVDEELDMVEEESSDTI
jgi:hypothetical protein